MYFQKELYKITILLPEVLTLTYLTLFVEFIKHFH
jgi:hypothetical protein